MRPYFPGGELNTFVSTLHIHGECATPCSQRLQPGLLGYLIRIAPLAFVPHRQIHSGQTLSPQVVFPGLLHFTATPKILLTPPGLKFNSVSCTPLSLAQRFHKRFIKPATDALGPIIMVPTRGAGVTAAAGTRLTHHLFFKVSTLEKSLAKAKHLGFPYHTFVHCKGFAPAAPRRARASISVPFSRLPLSRPLRIFGLVSLYLTNNLIRRRPILGCYL